MRNAMPFVTGLVLWAAFLLLDLVGVTRFRDESLAVHLLVFFVGATAPVFALVYKRHLHTPLPKIDQLGRSLNSSPWFDRNLQPRLPMPPFNGWAISDQTAAFLYNYIRESRPECILELGSGVSSLVLGYALEKNGKGKLYSIEGEKGFFNKSLMDINGHKLGHWVSLCHLPVIKRAIKDWAGLWYDMDDTFWGEIGKIDVMVVDGPPATKSTRARYPALPFLEDKLDSDAVVFLDDAARKDEQEVLKSWQKLGWYTRVLPIGDGLGVASRNKKIIDGF